MRISVSGTALAAGVLLLFQEQLPVASAIPLIQSTPLPVSSVGQLLQSIPAATTAVAKNAPIPYDERTANTAGWWLKIARAFTIASFAAFTATLIKIHVMCHCLAVIAEVAAHLDSALESFSVVLPVIAVAALSIAAAFDLEARHHTSKEMLEFLNRQELLLNLASSPREYNRLLVERVLNGLGYDTDMQEDFRTE